MFQDMLDFDAETYRYMKNAIGNAVERVKEFCVLETKLPPEGM